MLSAEAAMPGKAAVSSHRRQVFWVDNLRLREKPERKRSAGKQMDVSQAE